MNVTDRLITVDVFQLKGWGWYVKLFEGYAISEPGHPHLSFETSNSFGPYETRDIAIEVSLKEFEKFCPSAHYQVLSQTNKYLYDGAFQAQVLLEQR